MRVLRSKWRWLRRASGIVAAALYLTKSLQVRYWRESSSEASKEYWMSHTVPVFLLDRDGRIFTRIDHVNDPGKLMKKVVLTQGPSTMPSLGLKLDARRLPVTQPSGSLWRLQLPSGFDILS